MIGREADQAGVGNRDTVGVATEIGQHLFWATEGWLGVDDPLDPPQLIEPAGEGGGIGEAGQHAEEAEPAGCEGHVELGQEEAAEEPGEHAHRQKEAGATGDPAGAVEREATTRHDAMDMSVKVEVLPPGVADGEETDLSAEMPRIGGDDPQRL